MMIHILLHYLSHHVLLHSLLNLAEYHKVHQVLSHQK